MRMPTNWFGGSIARKLLLAFFSVSIITFLVTALVVQSAVRSAVTDSELANLSQVSEIKLSNLDARINQLATNLHAWAKLDVMNDLASGDVDKRVENTLENLEKDYALKGELYAFDAAGHLVAASDRLHNLDMLPEQWQPHGNITFVNKHHSPVDGDNIVVLVAPVMANFSENYQLGTLVLAYHWTEIKNNLPDNALLIYRQPSRLPQISMRGAASAIEPQPDLAADKDSVVLLESTLDTLLGEESLSKLANLDGWGEVGNQQYLVNHASQNSGLIAGWEIVMLQNPAVLHRTVFEVILKLALLGLVMTLPIFVVIRWLAKRLTSPLRTLTEFVSEIAETHDLSKRLELQTGDEIGILAADFNLMTERLESGSKGHREAEARLRATIDNALDAVVQMNSDGVVTGWNDQAENVFGWTRKEAVGRILAEMIIPPQYREAHIRGMHRYLATGKGSVLNSRIEMVGLHRGGYEFPVELAIAAITVHGQHEFSAFIRDITSKKESEEIIWKQANFDKLTNLPNRHMFHDRLDQEIKKAHRAELQMALLFIDLDHFKEINDTLGHDMGDILLMEVSRSITSCVRESDTVARLGGDEFTVILSEVNDTLNVERIAQSILKKLTEPFKLEDEVVYISASIGITFYPDDADSVEDLLKNADQAMYVAKSHGRNRTSYFTATLQEVAQERRRLTHDMRGALAGNQFVINFQPIIDLSDGRIHKAEALLRWQHPERGLLMPAEFIQLAEETALINGIGDYVFKEAARWARRWRELFAGDFQISVNMSPIQFQSMEHSCDDWSAYLHDIDLAGQNIVIEITEGLLLNAATGITDKLLKFRDSGIQVAIDDFGTGYSSLSYLKKFDIDFLKIDKSFVDNLEVGANDVALCEAIIVMAHKLGLKVIAEGVETVVQRRILTDAGCDFAQGFLFSEALSPEEFEVLLAEFK